MEDGGGRAALEDREVGTEADAAGEDQVGRVDRGEARTAGVVQQDVVAALREVEGVGAGPDAAVERARGIVQVTGE